MTSALKFLQHTDKIKTKNITKLMSKNENFIYGKYHSQIKVEYFIM